MKVALGARLERVLRLSRGRTAEYVKELRRAEWMTDEQAQEDQRRRVTALLEHAVCHDEPNSLSPLPGPR